MPHKLIRFIKENRTRFWFSILVNTLMLIFFNIFFYCRFHTVDDVFMEMIACGAYGDPDLHLIYTNSILGFALSMLYKITDQIPWYGIMHIIMAWISFSSIFYVFMNKKNKMLSVLVLAVLFIFSYEAYTKVQFTKTAAYLAAAGYSLIADAIEAHNDKKKILSGILFLWNSFMIRTGMFLGCSAVCAGMFVPMICRFIKDPGNKENKGKVYGLICAGLCSLLLVGLSFMADKLAYSSESWSNYIRFNEFTTQFQDIYMPSYDMYEKELGSMGISKDDYRLYAATDHNDPDLFNVEVMEKVRDLQRYKTIDSNEIVMFFLRGYNTIFKQRSLATYALYLVILFLMYMCFNKHDISSLISLFYTCFATLFAFAYTYFMHGWFDRTTIAVLFAFLITILYLFDPKDSRIGLRVSFAGIALLIIVSLFVWNAYAKWNMNDWKNEYDENHEVLNEIYRDKDHIYISRTSLPLWKKYYHPYDLIPNGAMKNYSTFGDWIANTPLYLSVLNNYDISNPYKDIVNNDKAYLIGNAENLQLVEDYIRRHYYPELEFVLVKNLGPYEVYSLVSDS